MGAKVTEVTQAVVLVVMRGQEGASEGNGTIVPFSWHHQLHQSWLRPHRKSAAASLSRLELSHHFRTLAMQEGENAEQGRVTRARVAR